MRIPFRSLHHLYHVSLQSLLNSMNRKALGGLFELEQEVRDARNGAQNSPQKNSAA